MSVTYSTRERRIINGGGAVFLSPGQCEVFLALYDTEEPLHVDDLARRLYPDKDTEEAEGAVRSVLSRLREKLKAIGSEEVLLSNRGNGYFIDRKRVKYR